MAERGAMKESGSGSAGGVGGESGEGGAGGSVLGPLHVAGVGGVHHHPGAGLDVRRHHDSGAVLEHRRLIGGGGGRSEEHTSELQSLMRISYAVFCLKTKKI